MLVGIGVPVPAGMRPPTPSTAAPARAGAELFPSEQGANMKAIRMPSGMLGFKRSPYEGGSRVPFVSCCRCRRRCRRPPPAACRCQGHWIACTPLPFSPNSTTRISNPDPLS